MGAAPVRTRSRPRPREGSARPRGAGPWPIVGLTALLVVPLVVAVIGFRTPTWTPVLDLAQTELRVRDVGTAHTPLIGLPGRIMYEAHQGSHPGPLSFYALAPTYRLFGANAWALQCATLVVHAAAIAVALALARRRGGTLLLLVVAAAIAVLVNGFGVTTLTEPWNPYLPLLWWVVVLLALWSVLCGDLVALPIAVVAACFCAQTHVPYLALCVGLGGLTTLVVLWRLRGADRSEARATRRWVVIAGAVGVVAWLPPVIDQLRESTGNLGIIFNYFLRGGSDGGHPEPVAGFGEAARVVLRHLDVFHLSVDQLAHPGLLVANDAHRHPVEWHGAVLLLAWAAAVVAVFVKGVGSSRLRWLHALVAGALAILFVSTGRIYGEVWFYLVLSMWAVAVMMTVATLWTAWTALRPRVADPEAMRRAAAIALVAVIVVFTARATWDAPSATHSDATVVRELRAVLPGTVAALDHHERYLLTDDDAAYFLSPMYGMLNELDRRGFDVGVIRSLGVIATKQRVSSEDEATLRIQIATGKWIDAWRAMPGAREVAFVDPRTPEQKARFDQLHDDVARLLTEQGRADLVPVIDLNLFATSIAPGVGRDIRSKLEEMLTLGVPMAVFIAPPHAHLGP